MLMGQEILSGFEGIGVDAVKVGDFVS